MKVILCYTSENGGFELLEKEYEMDEINFAGIIREYVRENKPKSQALSDKWEINGDPDPLFLNFRMDGINPTLFRLIDGYLDNLD